MSELKTWQHNIELAELKRLAAVFKSAHKPHVYGAFGLVKERDVAAAMAEGHFFYRQQNGAVGAAAIAKTLSSTSTHKTF
jgi:hypothetical protein